MSRRIERNFLNSSEISRHLFCSICTEVFRDPTRLFCGHTFCRKCLSHWLKDHHTCPFCRDEVDQQLMSKDHIASQLIQDLEVKCPNSDCSWTNRLEELEDHFKSCDFSKEPEWLARAQDFIEIDDEQISPDTTEIPPLIIDQLDYQIAQNAISLNLLHQAFSIKEETERLIEGMNNLQSISETLQLTLENRLSQFSNSTSESLIIDWTPTQKRKRPQRKAQNNSNLNINVIKSPTPTLHQIASKHKRDSELQKKKLKAIKDERDFFGLKQNKEDLDHDDDVVIDIPQPSSSRKKRGHAKRMINNDSFESIIKKTKTAAF